MADQLTMEDEGYNLTEDPEDLPLVYRDAICDRLFVEFLKLSEEREGKNHAILKVDFKDNVDGSYEGARIMMTVEFEITIVESNGSRSAHQPGKLLVKPVKYQQASHKSIRTCEVSIAPGLSLGYIIDTLLRSNLHYFYFITIHGQYFGCRDFVAQALHVLERAQCINPGIEDSTGDSPTPFVFDIHDTLGMRYTRDSVAVSPMDRGHFPYYTRIEAPYMPYYGCPRVLDIETMVNRYNMFRRPR
ncbi:hypothetical protein QQX98_000088 [Neonectria punicea]|uniref:DUF7770 domain-containing protein n=1 Tax=Neonectria punicea TaxID=979145 RepID=A0ABR1HVF0_9HYPO